MELLGTENVDITIEGNILVIKVDTSKEYGSSKTGKSTKIASTLGNKVIAVNNGAQVTVGLNVYKPKSYK